MKSYKLLQDYPVLLILLIGTVLWLALFSGAAAAPHRQGEDMAIITKPTSNSVIQGSVEIRGSADHPSFQFYIIEYSPEPVSGDQWHIVGQIQESPVVNGLLERWDTTSIADGSYTLRLRVVRLDGNYSEYFVQQVVISNSQPIPTDTPTGEAITVTATSPYIVLTPTSTPLPATPTIKVDQPVVETPTPRPLVPTSPPLEDPDSKSTFIPSVIGFSFTPLRSACLYGAGIMLSVFLLFGFLAALRTFIRGFIDQIRRRRS